MMEGDTEREREQERNSEGEKKKKKTSLKRRWGQAHLRETGEETGFVISHTHTRPDTHVNILRLFSGCFNEAVKMKNELVKSNNRRSEEANFSCRTVEESGFLRPASASRRDARCFIKS